MCGLNRPTVLGIILRLVSVIRIERIRSENADGLCHKVFNFIFVA